MLGIDEENCDVPEGTSAVLMELSMGAWDGGGVVEGHDELPIRLPLRIFRSCIAEFTSRCIAGFETHWV